MPTAAKLVSAICLAALAAIVSSQVMEAMPDSTDFGMFFQVNLAIGVLVGWLWLGPNSGDGWANAISLGLTSAALLFAVGLFVQSWNEMMRLSMMNRYDGPWEAVAAVFIEGARFFEFVTIEMGITLAVGGIISGVFADMTARRFS